MSKIACMMPQVGVNHSLDIKALSLAPHFSAASLKLSEVTH